MSFAGSQCAPEYQRLAGKAWLARIYQSKGTGPLPTIVDVHGGAWDHHRYAAQRQSGEITSR